MRKSRYTSPIEPPVHPSTCPLCESALKADTRLDGSEVALYCTACRWRADKNTPGIVLDSPWHRSSPETMSCEFCYVDYPTEHKITCPWSARNA